MLKNTKLVKEKNFNLILVLLIIIVGIALLSMSGCIGDKYESLEPRQYTEFTIHRNASGDYYKTYSYLSGEDIISYYDGKKMNVTQKMSFDIDVPKIGFDPNDFINLAKKRIDNKNVKLSGMKYHLPEQTELFFNKKSPSMVLRFYDTNYEYSVVYDIELREEIYFGKGKLRGSPLCYTIAEYIIEERDCAPEFQRDGLPLLTPFNEVWKPCFEWVKNNTNKDDVILTWWDYYGWFEILAERETVPEPYNEEKIQKAAKFLTLVKTEEEALEIAKEYNAQYVAIDWTMIGKSGAPHFIATSNLTTNDCGFYLSYGQLVFNPAFKYGSGPEDICDSTKEQYTLDEQGGVESTKCLGFVGGGYGMGAILFNIKNNAQISGIFIITSEGDKIPWETWRDRNNVSILGVQPLNAILGWAIRGDINNLVGRATQYNTLVYIPNVLDNGKGNRPQACVNDKAYYTAYEGYPGNNYNDYMLTKLYLGDYADSYYGVGLCTTDWCRKAAENGPSERLKYFKLVDEFDDAGESYSNGGYVRIYEIIYPEEMEE